MLKRFPLALALLVGSYLSSPLKAEEMTISAPVLSVYDDGFRVSHEGALPLRVDAWTLCGDRTREHLRRGDMITVQGDREWRFLYATSITRPDGTPACPEDAAPQYK